MRDPGLDPTPHGAILPSLTLHSVLILGVQQISSLSCVYPLVEMVKFSLLTACWTLLVGGPIRTVKF